MGIAASYLNHSHIEEEFNDSRSRLIRVALDISREVLHTGQPELSTGARNLVFSSLPCSPRIHVAFDVYSHSVAVTSCNLVNPLVPQLLYLKWVRLELNE